jgi:argininosuccinate lyase
MTYNRDMQEDKEPLFDSVDTIDLTLALYAEMMDGAKVNATRAAAAVTDPLLLATDLADYLVRKDVPFREAHEIVGKLVGESSRTGVALNELSAEIYRKASPAFGDDVAQVFDLRAALAARKAPGAPSAANVQARLAHWRSALA